MKAYGRITNRTFYNDWYGKVKNIPSAKLRNELLKKTDENDNVEVQLPVIKSRTTLKNLWRKQYCRNLFAD